MDIDRNSERARKPLQAAIYARTAAASQNDDDLQRQIEACKAEAAARLWAAGDAAKFERCQEPQEL